MSGVAKRGVSQHFGPADDGARTGLRWCCGRSTTGILRHLRVGLDVLDELSTPTSRMSHNAANAARLSRCGVAVTKRKTFRAKDEYRGPPTREPGLWWRTCRGWPWSCAGSSDSSSSCSGCLPQLGKPAQSTLQQPVAVHRTQVGSRRANVRAPTRSNHVGDREHGAPFRRTARDDLPHCTHMPPYRPNAGIFGLCAGRQNPHASRRVC